MPTRKYGEALAEYVKGLKDDDMSREQVRALIKKRCNMAGSVKNKKLHLKELELVMDVTRGAPNAAHVLMVIITDIGVEPLNGTALYDAARHGHSKEVLEKLASMLPPEKTKWVPAALVHAAVSPGLRKKDEDVDVTRPFSDLMEVGGVRATAAAWQYVIRLSQEEYDKWMPIFDRVAARGKMTPCDECAAALGGDDIAMTLKATGSLDALVARVADLVKRRIAKPPEYKQLSDALTVLRNWLVFHQDSPAYSALVDAYARYVAASRRPPAKPRLGGPKPLPPLAVKSAPPKRGVASTAPSAKRSRGSAAVARALQTVERRSKAARP